MATISQNQWKRYIARLRKVNDTAADRFKKTIIDRGGYENIDCQKLIDYAYAIATKYGEASAALSAEMYDAIAELSGAAVPSALPAETASYSEVAKTVNGIIKRSANENTLAQGIGRLVKMAGTDTILSNAYRDRPRNKGSRKRHSGAQVAWIPFGDTCPFCLMLASKGWQNQTQWAVNSHSEHIHANCDCTYAVRFNNNLNVEGYDPDEYKAIYDNAEGRTRNEKFNSMRRDYYAANKDKINAQKRAAYALKTERNNLPNNGKNGIINLQKEANSILNRARNINTFEDLQKVSNSKILAYDNIADIKEYFINTHNVSIENFTENDLLGVKATLAGLDDMINEFPEIRNNINTVRYVPNLGSMGEWNSSGLIKIGKKGLKDYGTGVHESAHALDYVRSENGVKYSEQIVEEARKSLNLRSNSKEYRNQCVRITGDVADTKNPQEIFAYAIETAKGGVRIDLADAILKLVSGV